MDVDSVVADLEAATEAVIQEHHGLPAIRFDGTQPDMQCQCGKAHPCSARVLYREAKQAAVALKEMRERQECGICGQQTLTRNPHPDAGKPEHLLTVGATWECIPCNRRALHTAAEQGQEYRRKLTEAVRLLTVIAKSEPGAGELSDSDRSHMSGVNCSTCEGFIQAAQAFLKDASPQEKVK